MSKIIALEGQDHCGKSTQAKLLVAYLKTQGFKVAHVKAPINDVVLYNVIYWMLRNGYASMFPYAFQYLQYTNKKLFQTFKLPKLDKENDFIVFDRWRLSALIYGNASFENKDLNQKLYDSLKSPDYTIIMSGEPLTTEHDDEYETNTYLQNKVRNGYIEWAFKQPSSKVAVIKSNGTRLNIHNEIIHALEDADILW